MRNEWLARQAGTLGIGASLLIWLMALPVLGLAMRANEAASSRGLIVSTQVVVLHRHLHAVAVLWGLMFVLLQLLAPLLLAFTLRSFYKFRVAVCVSISTVSSILIDGLGLLGLLVWLRFREGAG